jgi:hypothetical protein
VSANERQSGIPIGYPRFSPSYLGTSLISQSVKQNFPIVFLRGEDRFLPIHLTLPPSFFFVVFFVGLGIDALFYILDRFQRR